MATYHVDKAVRSAVDPDLLRAIDSAIGQVFYSSVFEILYPRIRNAILATWRESLPRS
jgi:hypothetical protein